MIPSGSGTPIEDIVNEEESVAAINSDEVSMLKSNNSSIVEGDGNQMPLIDQAQDNVVQPTGSQEKNDTIPQSAQPGILVVGNKPSSTDVECDTAIPPVGDGEEQTPGHQTSFKIHVGVQNCE